MHALTFCYRSSRRIKLFDAAKKKVPKAEAVISIGTALSELGAQWADERLDSIRQRLHDVGTDYGISEFVVSGAVSLVKAGHVDFTGRVSLKKFLKPANDLVPPSQKIRNAAGGIAGTFVGSSSDMAAADVSILSLVTHRLRVRLEINEIVYDSPIKTKICHALYKEFLEAAGPYWDYETMQDLLSGMEHRMSDRTRRLAQCVALMMEAGILRWVRLEKFD
ncbi:hypothetical protein JCM11641_004822 [Rhodosporidiobolus odoratus]